MPNSIVYNSDCLAAMREMPDKAFELAIVDPPYGISAEVNAHRNGVKCKANGFREYAKKDWDSSIPPPLYFEELKRVSINQIICGANYFTQYLPPTMGWVFWYKGQPNFSFSDGEMIFTSFQTKTRIFEYPRGKNSADQFHPTQKPIALYRWLLKNYAKPGDRILDTHVGSGSSRIACYECGFDFTGFEIDKEYFDAMEDRFQKYISQGVLF